MLRGGGETQKVKIGCGGGGTSKGSGKKNRMGVHGAVLACENGEPYKPSLEHLSLYTTPIGNFGSDASGKPVSMSTKDKAMVQKSYC